MTNLAPWTWGRKNLPAKTESHPAYSLQREMNRLFDEFFGSFDQPVVFFESSELSAFTPKIDVKETEKEILVTAELPGMEEKDVSVTLVNDSLTIFGEKSEEKKEDVKGHYRMERTYGSFRRVLPLPVDIEAEKVTAEFKNGVLSVKMPKCAEVQKKAKSIPINKI
jgi:HSP20 family protein